MRRIVVAWLFWACATVVVRTQEPANRTPVIGWLSPATTQSYHQAGADQPGPQLLRDSLARHGLVDGKNIRIDMRLAEGKLERLPALAQAMVREGANVILAFGEPAAQAALIATKTIPIVAVGDDLVGSGLAATLAKPGGNVTGVSILATELDAKKIEVLKELLPDSKRLGALNDPATSGPDRAQSMADTARLLGVDLQVIDIRRADDLEHAFAVFRAGGVEGVNVVSSAMLTGLRLRLGELSLAARSRRSANFATWRKPDA